MNWYIKGFRSQIDCWSSTHLLFPYVFADLSGAWWVGVGAAFIWECLDVWWWWYVYKTGMLKAKRSNITGLIYLEPRFWDSILDRRGFSVVDFALGCIGVLGWVIKNIA